ncbi:two-component system, OmpR family, sensor histidine kinase BraS/BceS [Peptostreptococcus russellii]|uniref:histidine kinase n=1 Tax=Peptostreptococcus russellii TaxID=215200 RepID=A0A1H8JD57_9FIRM|nr:sensor histidine kinase [Peptostreptococcus russellii]SEN78734.1 two-component system, OmpR family, sensor histidine kinase BraS/BceS [Peptostreptococcus russellii]
MGKIKGALKKEAGIIFISITVLLIFAGVFKINDYDMKVYFMAMEIFIFVLIIYILISILYYKQEENLKSKIESLEIEKKMIIDSSIEEKNSVYEYFLLWIHQIKTPITAAKLLVDREEISPAEIKKQIFYIEDYTNMALNFLKISNKEADMDITEIDLDKVVKNVIKKYSILFISDRITLKYDKIEEKVVSDTKWLSILLEQIVSNAIKYSQGGEVEIRFHKFENCLEIRDTGIGIRAEDIPKIFDRGYSGFNGRMNQKSSGIGLFLASEIAKKLSIDIKVDSKLSKGSSFRLYFKA